MTSPGISAETARRIEEHRALDRGRNRVLWAWTLIGVVILPMLTAFAALYVGFFTVEPTASATPVRQGASVGWVAVVVQSFSTLVVVVLAGRWKLGVAQMALTMTWLIVGGVAAAQFFSQVAARLG